MDKNVIFDAMKYIDEHFEERITLEELAKKFWYSKHIFLREFKNVTGMTVLSYINKRRFEWAREMLNEGKSCSYVSDVLGYNSLNAFRYSYEKYFGVNPIKDRMNFKAGKRPFKYHYKNGAEVGIRKKAV